MTQWVTVCLAVVRGYLARKHYLRQRHLRNKSAAIIQAGKPITLLQMNVAVCKGIGQKEYITSGFCQSKQKINQKTKKKREPD